MLYEHMKHTGELPIIGVNTYLNPNTEGDGDGVTREVARSTDEEKQHQLQNLRAFHAEHAAKTPEALKRLQTAAESGGNIFAELMEVVNVASLGQISAALYEVGGQYRRNM